MSGSHQMTILCMSSYEKGHEFIREAKRQGWRVLFLTVDKAKFRRPVVPGNVVEYHMRKLAQRRTMWWFRGEARVAGQLAAEAELGAMIADE